MGELVAGLLCCAGLLHIGLLRDLRRPADLALARLVGGVGFAFNLAVAVALGLALYWLGRAIGAVRRAETAAEAA